MRGHPYKIKPATFYFEVLGRHAHTPSIKHQKPGAADDGAGERNKTTCVRNCKNISVDLRYEWKIKLQWHASGIGLVTVVRLVCMTGHEASQIPKMNPWPRIGGRSSGWCGDWGSSSSASSSSGSSSSWSSSSGGAIRPINSLKIPFSPEKTVSISQCTEEHGKLTTYKLARASAAASARAFASRLALPHG